MPASSWTCTLSPFGPQLLCADPADIMSQKSLPQWFWHLINHSWLLASMLFCIHKTKVSLQQNHSNIQNNFLDSLVGILKLWNFQSQTPYLYWYQHCLGSFHNITFISEYLQQKVINTSASTIFKSRAKQKQKTNNTVMFILARCHFLLMIFIFVYLTYMLHTVQYSEELQNVNSKVLKYFPVLIGKNIYKNLLKK